MHQGAGEDVFQVIEERKGKHHGAQFMKEEDGAETAYNAGEETR